MLDKTYDAASVEPRIYESWERAGAFKAGAGAKPDASPFSLVIPPPNVTGSLHMGHALNNTLQDVLVRFHRMKGRDVLWQPGMDHAGIATQMVVERQMTEGQESNRREIGRERFVEKVWAWKAESGGLIINQLKRLGCSCDWSRERFTMDEGLSRAVIKVFVDLYRAGLIYKDKRLVNWDPGLRTAISDLEVEQVETNGKLWHLKYPIEGGQGAGSGEAATGNDKDGRFIVVATTRPETMLGDTAVAVHPDDERYRDLVGKNAILPLVGRKLKVVADEYADPATGSGAVKITPAHDFNDFEVGKRHDLPMINIFDVEANVILDGNADFLADLRDSEDLRAAVKLLHGQERFTARKRLVEMLQAKDFVEQVEDHAHSVPHGDRSGVPIEPFLTEQWYADAKTLAAPAIASVREGRTVFVPKNWEKTYFDWMENIQPWCISRQLWWGHRIPAWYGPIRQGGKLDFSKWEIIVAENEADALAAAAEKYGAPVHVVASEQEALATGRALQGQGKGKGKGRGKKGKGGGKGNTKAEEAKQPRTTQPSVPLWRDEDVLDTWFSSALWPFSTLGWPEETPELKRYYPTTTLVTGFDIIFFWVARMMMMGLHFTKTEPFRDVYIHGIVRDEKGAKMSKSKGNVIDPLELMDEFGADALRFTMAALATPGRDVKPGRSRVEGNRNFATKIWNAARYAEQYGCIAVAGFDPATATQTLNRWIATETRRTATVVTEAIEAYRFNDAASTLYRFIWNLFCDWYLELSKPVLNGDDSAAKEETRATVAWVFDRILCLLHPMMPFITEELWSVVDSNRPLLAVSEWPTPTFEDTAAAEEINWVIDLISAIRSVRSEMNVPAGASLPLSVSGATFKIATLLQAYDAVIRRLARIEVVSLASKPVKGAVQVVVGALTLSLPLAGVVDLEAEKARLSRELDRVEKEIAKIDAKLANENFISRAPEEVVAEQRERLVEANALRDKTRAALSRVAE